MSQLGGSSQRENDWRAKSPIEVPRVDLVPLQSILCTEELHRRPARPPDYETENRALVSLSHALADSPQSILQTMAETMLEIFRCDSAGFSMLTRDEQSFFWPAIAGAWQPHLGGGTPRDFGPCGDVLDCNAPLLFSHWERRYPYLLEATPLAEEGLIVPFHVGGRAVGTIWVITHGDRRRFDKEDLRQLESLGRFASAAYRVVDTLGVLTDSMRHGQEARVEAADANRAKDVFLATLSHELRQPLNSIVAWVRMLRRGDVVAEAQPPLFEKLERSVASLTRLINDVLDVSAIVTGKMRLSLQSIDVRQPIEAALENARPAAVAKGIDLETDLEPTVPAITGDPDRLQQVVGNLLWNAVKFTPAGGRVTIRLRHDGARAAIAVIDSGQGISREFLPRLFDRFSQASEGPNKAALGLGLGLALARDLVGLHGGTIAAESPGEGRGSTFTVSLPIPSHRNADGGTSSLTTREHELLSRECADHPVAACTDCGKVYRFRDLITDQLSGKFHRCPQCRRDVTPSIREHLLSCGVSAVLEAQEVRARAGDVIDTARKARKDSEQLRDTTELRRAERDAERGASATEDGPRPSGDSARAASSNAGTT